MKKSIESLQQVFFSVPANRSRSNPLETLIEVMLYIPTSDTIPFLHENIALQLRRHHDSPAIIWVLNRSAFSFDNINQVNQESKNQLIGLFRQIQSQKQGQWGNGLMNKIERIIKKFNTDG